MSRINGHDNVTRTCTYVLAWKTTVMHASVIEKRTIRVLSTGGGRRGRGEASPPNSQASPRKSWPLIMASKRFLV